MKRFGLFLICTAVFSLMASCTDTNKVSYNEKRDISTVCDTHGFAEGGQETKALWSEGEKFNLYRSGEWLPVIMTLAQGANTGTARFTGVAIVSNSDYYGVRPATAVSTVRNNGAATITVKPNNIFLAEENSSLVVPQIGKGNTNKMEFTNIFGVLKFPNGNGNANLDGATMVEFMLPKGNQGLHGVFEYNFKNGSMRAVDVKRAVSREFNAPLSESIYLALPEGEYATIELIAHYSEGESKLFTIEDVTVTCNAVTTIDNLVAVSLPSVVGSWRIKSFCGAEATADIYMEFLHDGTFNLYQRTENMAYQTFTGTYTVESATSTISGTYSDGTDWADSYKFSLNEDKELVLEGLNSGEISVYERCEIPTILPERTSRGGVDVKPL